MPVRFSLKNKPSVACACRELYEKGMLEAPGRAVWLQIAGLLGTAIAATLQRALRTIADTACGLYALAMLVVRPARLGALRRRPRNPGTHAHRA